MFFQLIIFFQIFSMVCCKSKAHFRVNHFFNHPEFYGVRSSCSSSSNSNNNDNNSNNNG